MPEIHPAVATPRRMDVDHGSGERTAGAAVKTREQIAVAAIQDILKQEDYNPKFLKDLIKACRKLSTLLFPVL